MKIMGTGRNSVEHPILIFSVAVTILFWVETFVLGFMEAGKGYSQIQHTISLLMLADPPLGVIHRFSFIFLGAAIFGYAFITWKQGAEKTIALYALVGLLVLHGIGRFAEAVFLWDPDAPTGISSMLHQALGAAGVIAMIPIPFLAARVVSQKYSNSNIQKVSILFGIAFLILFAAGIIFSLIPPGLGQRIGFILWYLWLIFFILNFRKPKAHPD